MGSTMVKIGPLLHRFLAIKLPDLQSDPQPGDGWVRFVQTTGGRAGLPAPRRVRRRPYVQWQAPLIWTTLSLTLHADGREECALIGASRFPRHWVYDGNGQLSYKSGLTDFGDWFRKSFGRRSPWGDADSPPLVTAVETALERSLSAQLMHGAAKPSIRRLEAGEVLVRQGEPGTSIYLVLDGVIRVDRNGERLAEYGPGALLGERAHLEGGVRTATLTAVTPSRVASAEASQFDRSALLELSRQHRRETTTKAKPRTPAASASVGHDHPSAAEPGRSLAEGLGDLGERVGDGLIPVHVRAAGAQFPRTVLAQGCRDDRT